MKYPILNNLKESFFDFIEGHAGEDASDLALKYAGHDLGFPLDFAILQISLRKKCSRKLAGFISRRHFLFPDGISSEQASDERVAAYHASLCGSGKRVLDMTAGLGIDAMSIAMHGNRVTSCELDPLKCECLRHNADLLESARLEVINADCRIILKDISDTDIIFIDPARRNIDKSRAYSFRDCTPDVLDMMDEMRNVARHIFIKASPLLDISAVLTELPDTSRIHLVCARRECKELLVEIDGSEFKGVKIVDLLDNGEPKSEILFSQSELNDFCPPIASVDEIENGSYLYEPNPGMMKLSCYGVICRKFERLKRISSNTSLYLSRNSHPDFPGRMLRIDSILDKKGCKELKGERYNVAVRNYPLSAAELRKKLKVKEGQDRFIYGFRAGERAFPMLVAASIVAGPNT